MNEDANGGLIARIRAWIIRRSITSVLTTAAAALVIAAAITIPIIASGA